MLRYTGHCQGFFRFEALWNHIGEPWSRFGACLRRLAGTARTSWYISCSVTHSPFRFECWSTAVWSSLARLHSASLFFSESVGIAESDTLSSRIVSRTSKATRTRIRFQKDPFSKRSVFGCPHVSYVNPETPFTQTLIDPWKRAPTCLAHSVLCWQTPTRLEFKSHFFAPFLCLPVSFSQWRIQDLSHGGGGGRGILRPQNLWSLRDSPPPGGWGHAPPGNFENWDAQICIFHYFGVQFQKNRERICKVICTYIYNFYDFFFFFFFFFSFFFFFLAGTGAGTGGARVPPPPPLDPLLVLLYCFACLYMCPEEGVYVVCESWSQLIKESRSKRKPAKEKTRPSSGKRTKSSCFWREPHFLWPKSILRFDFEGNSLQNKKEMSCYRFGQRDCTCTCSNIHLGIASLISFETVAEKIRIPCSQAKKDPDPKPPFSKDPLSGAFSKGSVLGPQRYQKAPDPCGYVWPFL